jgi:Flp pilus assembly protein TadG
MTPTIPSRTHTNALHSRGRFGNRRGQSLVEFSLIAPLLLAAVTGMVSFGLAIYNYLVLIQGVNSAVTTLSMSRGQTTDPCSAAYTALRNAAPSLQSGQLTVSFNINGYTSSSTSCSSGANYMVQGTSATMTAQYPCVLAVYGISSPGCNLKAQTAEVIQ